MACSRQNVLSAPRGASGGHCAIVRRTRGSTGSKRAMALKKDEVRTLPRSAFGRFSEARVIRVRS